VKKIIKEEEKLEKSIQFTLTELFFENRTEKDQDSL